MTSSFFHCLHENTKTAFSKIYSLGSVFGKCVSGHRFHRIRVERRLIRKEKVAFSNENGYGD